MIFVKKHLKSGMKIELLETDASWIWIFLGKTKLRLVLKALSSTDQKFGTLYQLISKTAENLNAFKDLTNKWNGVSCNCIVIIIKILFYN